MAVMSDPDARPVAAPGEHGAMTVGQVAGVLGLTVRTLHHWDQIELASPSFRTASGYRLYTGTDVARLQRITIYRELGLGLDAIAEVLRDEADIAGSLRDQRRQVRQQLRRLKELDTGLDRMIQAHESGVLLSAEQQLEIFGEGWDPQWIEQARQRWGDSLQWRQYAERAADRTPEQWKDVASRTHRLDRRLGAALREGVEPSSAEAGTLADEHREVFSAYFSLSVSMQVCLGRMYTEDPAFTAHYDSLQPGLAHWLREAIEANARRHGVDPATATWE